MADIRRALDDAAARGLEIEVVPRPPARSLVEAAAGLRIKPRQLVKTMVVRRGENDFLFVLLPGDRQISWPKLRALLKVNRLSLPAAEVALAATGYARGTITPLGSTTAWPVFADELITGRIALGSGAPDQGIFVESAELWPAYDVTIADLSEKPAEP